MKDRANTPYQGYHGQGVAVAAPGKGRGSLTRARSGPGAAVKPGLTRRVRPGLGNRRLACASVRNYGLGRPAICACRR